MTALQAKVAWVADAKGELSRELTVVVPVKTISESNARGHWSKKAGRARNQRMVTGLVFGSAWRLEPIGLPLEVTLTRTAPSSGLDDDNLRGALKAVRDAVASVLGVDDRDPRVRYRYAQARGPYAVAVCVRRRTPEATDGATAGPERS